MESISTKDRTQDEPKPCLTMRVKVSVQTRAATFSGPFPYQEHPEDKTIDSGFDPNGPAGPTWWCIVEREGRKFYLSTIRNSGGNVFATEDGQHVCRPTARPLLRRYRITFKSISLTSLSWTFGTENSTPSVTIVIF